MKENTVRAIEMIFVLLISKLNLPRIETCEAMRNIIAAGDEHAREVESKRNQELNELEKMMKLLDIPGQPS
jgi:hypothetical protein